MTKKHSPQNQNYVEHDIIYVFDTINYTNRYRFYNDIENLINTKLTQIQKFKSVKKTFTPVIEIVFDCPDQQMYPRQTARFFDMVRHARKSGIIIETTVQGATSGWASTMATMYATPGFRNMYEDAYHYYYETNYDKETRKNIKSATPTVHTAQMSLAEHFCDNIFLNNGKIKTR